MPVFLFFVDIFLAIWIYIYIVILGCIRIAYAILFFFWLVSPIGIFILAYNFHTNGHPHIHERDVLMPLSMYSFLCLLRLPARGLGVSSYLVLISLILRGVVISSTYI